MMKLKVQPGTLGFSRPGPLNWSLCIASNSRWIALTRPCRSCDGQMCEIQDFVVPNGGLRFQWLNRFNVGGQAPRFHIGNLCDRRELSAPKSDAVDAYQAVPIISGAVCREIQQLVRRNIRVYVTPPNRSESRAVHRARPVMRSCPIPGALFFGIPPGLRLLGVE
jgi:hypothetical protein